MSEEILSLRGKNAVSMVPEDFTTSIFFNLKQLNHYVATQHFKMRTVKGLIQSGDWLVKRNLKDAYLAIPIHPSH